MLLASYSSVITEAPRIFGVLVLRIFRRGKFAVRCSASLTGEPSSLRLIG